jgi:ribosomal protein S12 methylthiotransferase accessory factor YcaO
MTEDKQENEVLEGEIVGEEEIVHPHVDFTPEEYQSRSTDKAGNPDDKFTEKEAVKLAEADGAEIRDFWFIANSTLQSVDNVEYASPEEAKDALNELDDKENLAIAQGRHTVRS